MKKLLAALVAVPFVAAAAWFAYDQGARRPLPEGLLQANGRIEGDSIVVASKFPGRVVELLVREGDDVQAGQELLHLDDRQVLAKAEQARQVVASLEAQILSAETSLELLRKQVPLEIDSAQAGVDHAQAAMAIALENALQAERELQRHRQLYETNAVDQQTFERIELASKVARKEHDSAKTAAVRAQTLLALAQLGAERIRAQQDELAALRARRDEAKAALAEAESILQDLEILAPVAGTVTARMVDVGEVVAAGAPLLEIVDLDRLYLKVFVPQSQIGKVRRGLPARVYCDAFPDEPASATVRYVSPRAEFTPKEVQTPDERVKLVYAVKLYLDDNAARRFTPGQPADAVIRWKEEVPWQRPKW
jgi:HlyD family secretion protein